MVHRPTERTLANQVLLKGNLPSLAKQQSQPLSLCNLHDLCKLPLKHVFILKCRIIMILT